MKRLWFTLGSFLAYEGDIGSLWGHFWAIFRYLLSSRGDVGVTSGHFRSTLGWLLGDFECPWESNEGRFEHFMMGFVSLRVHLNDFGIIFVDFQKIHIFLIDFNDFMELWSQLESTLRSFCGFRSVNKQQNLT